MTLRSRARQLRKEAEGIWREIGPQARHPDYRSKKKPAAGRCYQTALWMREKFKGHGKPVLVQGAEGSCKKHYWIRVGGVDVDITGDQYGHPKVQVGSLPYQGKVRSWPKSRAPSGHPGAMMRAHANLHPTARTAITRKGPSAPVKALWKEGLIQEPVLDFGSGRGEDVRWLRRKGVEVDAYDPHHGPAQLPDRKYATILATYVHCVLPRAQQAKATKEIRSRLRDGGRGLITVRTDTCPNPPGGVQECVSLSSPVAARGSGFQTFEVRRTGSGQRAKSIGSRSWVHHSALSELPPSVQRRVKKLGGKPDLVRFDSASDSIMLGWAPGLGRAPVPHLKRSELHRPGRPVLRKTYKGESQPVYHRTELMFLPNDRRRKSLARKSEELERKGFLGRSDIGTRRAWKRVTGRKNRRGFSIVYLFPRTGRRSIKEALAEFGTTTDPNKAGFILPDGRFLDLSYGQRHRVEDHRVVERWVEGEFEYRTEAMNEWLRKTGAIRFSYHEDGFVLDTETELTSAQKRTIGGLMRSRPEWVAAAGAGTDAQETLDGYPRAAQVFAALAPEF